MMGSALHQSLVTSCLPHARPLTHMLTLEPQPSRLERPPGQKPATNQPPRQPSHLCRLGGQAHVNSFH